MPRALKSITKLWPQSKTAATRYRDRKRVRLPDGTGKEVFGYGSTIQAETEELYRKVGTPLMARTVYRARNTLIEDLDLPKSTLHCIRCVKSTRLI